MLNRRQWLSLAASSPVWLAASAAGAPPAPAPRSQMGITWGTYRLGVRASRSAGDDEALADAFNFLGVCQETGAGGIQVPVQWIEAASPGKVRRAAELAGMYVETSVSLPRDQGDLSRFQDALRAARNAGATVVRASMMNSPRYRTFDSEEAVKTFAVQSWRSLTLAEPLLRKRRMRLALENHRDLRLEELGSFVKRLSSEFLGACIDPANGLALLESPMEVVAALAPYAFSVHLKDVAVEEYEHGYRIAEVPLGEGILDLPKIVQFVRQARPAATFSLDVIAGDPTEVPFLTDGYWMSLPKLPGWLVGRTLGWVRQNQREEALPLVSEMDVEQQLRLEDENVRMPAIFFLCFFSLCISQAPKPHSQPPQPAVGA